MHAWIKSMKCARRKRFRVAAGLVCLICTLSAAAHSQTKGQAKLLVTNAYFFTEAPGQEKPFTGYMLVGADGRIEAIGEGAAPADAKAAAVLDAKGDWIVPGFISAHSHLWQSAYRGLAQDKELDGWIASLYGVHAPKADAEGFYWFTLDGCLDHLRHGVTGAYNFNYSSVEGKGGVNPLAIDEAEFRAESESGIRFIHGINIGRVGPKWSDAQAEAHVKAFMDWTAKQPGGKSDRFLRTMVNGAGVWTDSDEQAKGEAKVMRDLKIGNQQHFLEPRADAALEQSKFRWMLDTGMLSPDVLWGHFVHPNQWILEQTVKAGVGVSWNPLSNGRLASGTADIPLYLKMGIHVGMGVDGEASADRADPFENMRMGLYAVRMKYESAAVLAPQDVLRMHTLGSAQVLGVADRLGSLEKGKLADFLLISPAEFGHVYDPYATLVFVAGVEDIDRIYVGGELKVQHSEVVGQDVAKVRREAAQRVQ